MKKIQSAESSAERYRIQLSDGVHFQPCKMDNHWGNFNFGTKSTLARNYVRGTVFLSWQKLEIRLIWLIKKFLALI